MKFRKKPVVIEAFQYEGDLINSDGSYCCPVWASKAFEEGVLYHIEADLFIKTLEGDMCVSVNDFIIQGVAGEIYPCKPDIFGKTYEKVEE